MNELISIIIPVYNAAKYLPRCIDSLLAQTYKNIEVVLVNDSSKDDSAKVCEEYAKKDSRVKFYSKQNEGAGMARNYGIAKANGELLGFCDADDYVGIEMYEKMLQAINQDNYDLAYCLHTNEFNEPVITGSTNSFCTKEAVRELMLGEVGTKPSVKEDVLYGSAVWRGLYRKDIIVKNNIAFLSEREVGSEDLLFNLEYLRFCNKVIYLQDEFYHHCDNLDSMTHSKSHFIIEHEIKLYDEVSRILSQDDADDYLLQLKRLFIKRIRVALIRIGRESSKGEFRESYGEVSSILGNKRLQEILKNYPGNQLPLKHSLMFYCMKHNLRFLCLMLCKL